MTTTAIREKLHDYIRDAEDEKVEALYLILGVEIEQTYSWEKDEEFVAELDERLDKLNSGEDPGRTWGDIEASIAILKSERSKV
jgi:hypothetical protein